MMDIYALALMLLATIITFGLYMQLAGIDSPFFTFAEHSFLGAAVGFSGVVTITYIWQKVVQPIIGNAVTNWSIVVALILGLMMLTRISAKYSYLSRIPITIAMAVGIGISTRTIIFTDLLQQASATIRPLWGVALDASFTAIINIILIVTALLYFLYTIRPPTQISGGYNLLSRIGRYVLYGGFGVLFAQTFMGRIGLFLGRMNTMLFPIEQRYATVVIASLMVLITIILYKRYPKILKKITPES